MFCYRKNDPSTVSCESKLVSELISLFSIIFSGIVIYVTAKYTKLNIVNHLILQILISEIIDGVDILLVIFEDAQWPRTFENFYSRRRICFTQIFLSLFVCLWTVISAFFISLRIYDITVRNNTFFKKKFMKNIHYLVAFFSFFFTFWFWVIQTLVQAKQLKDSEDKAYHTSRPHLHFRHMYCWFEESINYVIFPIVLIIIGGSLFFSIKGICKLQNIKDKITEELEFNESNYLSKKKSDISKIIRTLWIYPLVSAILWIIYFILQIVSYHTVSAGLSFVYVIIISLRQPIYTVVFLVTQQTIKKEFINFVTFKTCRRRENRSVINPINQINPVNPTNPMNQINYEKTNLINIESIN